MRRQHRSFTALLVFLSLLCTVRVTRAQCNTTITIPSAPQQLNVVYAGCTYLQPVRIVAASGAVNTGPHFVTFLDPTFTNGGISIATPTSGLRLVVASNLTRRTMLGVTNASLVGLHNALVLLSGDLHQTLAVAIRNVDLLMPPSFAVVSLQAGCILNQDAVLSIEASSVRTSIMDFTPPTPTAWLSHQTSVFVFNSSATSLLSVLVLDSTFDLDATPSVANAGASFLFFCYFAAAQGVLVSVANSSVRLNGVASKHTGFILSTSDTTLNYIEAQVANTSLAVEVMGYAGRMITNISPRKHIGCGGLVELWGDASNLDFSFSGVTAQATAALFVLGGGPTFSRNISIVVSNASALTLLRPTDPASYSTENAVFVVFRLTESLLLVTNQSTIAASNASLLYVTGLAGYDVDSNMLNISRGSLVTVANATAVVLDDGAFSGSSTAGTVTMNFLVLGVHDSSSLKVSGSFACAVSPLLMYVLSPLTRLHVNVSANASAMVVGTSSPSRDAGWVSLGRSPSVSASLILIGRDSIAGISVDVVSPTTDLLTPFGAHGSFVYALKLPPLWLTSNVTLNANARFVAEAQNTTAVARALSSGSGIGKLWNVSVAVLFSHGSSWLRSNISINGSSHMIARNWHAGIASAVYLTRSVVHRSFHAIASYSAIPFTYINQTNTTVEGANGPEWVLVNQTVIVFFAPSSSMVAEAQYGPAVVVAALNGTELNWTGYSYTDAVVAARSPFAAFTYFFSCGSEVELSNASLPSGGNTSAFNTTLVVTRSNISAEAYGWQSPTAAAWRPLFLTDTAGNVTSTWAVSLFVGPWVQYLSPLWTVGVNTTVLAKAWCRPPSMFAPASGSSSSSSSGSTNNANYTCNATNWYFAPLTNASVPRNPTWWLPPLFGQRLAGNGLVLTATGTLKASVYIDHPRSHGLASNLFVSTSSLSHLALNCTSGAFLSEVVVNGSTSCGFLLNLSSPQAAARVPRTKANLTGGVHSVNFVFAPLVNQTLLELRFNQTMVLASVVESEESAMQAETRINSTECLFLASSTNLLLDRRAVLWRPLTIFTNFRFISEVKFGAGGAFNIVYRSNSTSRSSSSAMLLQWANISLDASSVPSSLVESTNIAFLGASIVSVAVNIISVAMNCSGISCININLDSESILLSSIFVSSSVLDASTGLFGGINIRLGSLGSPTASSASALFVVFSALSLTSNYINLLAERATYHNVAVQLLSPVAVRLVGAFTQFPPTSSSSASASSPWTVTPNNAAARNTSAPGGGGGEDDAAVFCHLSNVMLRDVSFVDSLFTISGRAPPTVTHIFASASLSGGAVAGDEPLCASTNFAFINVTFRKSITTTAGIDFSLGAVSIAHTGTTGLRSVLYPVFAASFFMSRVSLLAGASALVAVRSLTTTSSVSFSSIAMDASLPYFLAAWMVGMQSTVDAGTLLSVTGMATATVQCEACNTFFVLASDLNIKQGASNVQIAGDPRGSTVRIQSFTARAKGFSFSNVTLGARCTLVIATIASFVVNAFAAGTFEHSQGMVFANASLGAEAVVLVSEVSLTSSGESIAFHDPMLAPNVTLVLWRSTLTSYYSNVVLRCYAQPLRNFTVWSDRSSLVVAEGAAVVASTDAFVTRMRRGNIVVDLIEEVWQTYNGSSNSSTSSAVMSIVNSTVARQQSLDGVLLFLAATQLRFAAVDNFLPSMQFASNVAVVSSNATNLTVEIGLPRTGGDGKTTMSTAVNVSDIIANLYVHASQGNLTNVQLLGNTTGLSFSAASVVSSQTLVANVALLANGSLVDTTVAMMPPTMSMTCRNATLCASTVLHAAQHLLNTVVAYEESAIAITVTHVAATLGFLATAVQGDMVGMAYSWAGTQAAINGNCARRVTGVALLAANGTVREAVVELTASQAWEFVLPDVAVSCSAAQASLHAYGFHIRSGLGVANVSIINQLTTLSLTTSAVPMRPNLSVGAVVGCLVESCSLSTFAVTSPIQRGNVQLRSGAGAARWLEVVVRDCGSTSLFLAHRLQFLTVSLSRFGTISVIAPGTQLWNATIDSNASSLSSPFVLFAATSGAALVLLRNAKTVANVSVMLQSGRVEVLATAAQAAIVVLSNITEQATALNVSSPAGTRLLCSPSTIFVAPIQALDLTLPPTALVLFASVNTSADITVACLGSQVTNRGSRALHILLYTQSSSVERVTLRLEDVAFSGLFHSVLSVEIAAATFLAQAVDAATPRLTVQQIRLSTIRVSLPEVLASLVNFTRAVTANVTWYCVYSTFQRLPSANNPLVTALSSVAAFSTIAPGVLLPNGSSSANSTPPVLLFGLSRMSNVHATFDQNTFAYFAFVFSNVAALWDFSLVRSQTRVTVMCNAWNGKWMLWSLVPTYLGFPRDAMFATAVTATTTFAAVSADASAWMQPLAVAAWFASMSLNVPGKGNVSCTLDRFRTFSTTTSVSYPVSRSTSPSPPSQSPTATDSYKRFRIHLTNTYSISLSRTAQVTQSMPTETRSKVTSTMSFVPKVCPLLMLWTVPSPLTELHIADSTVQKALYIRLLGPNASFIAAPTEYITLTLDRAIGALPELSGFSNRLGRVLRGELWVPAAAASDGRANYSQFSLTIPTVPTFSIQTDERIFVTTVPAVVYHGCDPTFASFQLRSQFEILSTMNQDLVKVAAVAAVSVASLTVVAGLFASASPFDAQALMLLGLMPCSVPLQRQFPAYMRYFLSPFVDLGWLWMMVGGICLIVGVAILQFVTVFFVAACAMGSSRRPISDATTLVAFPSWTYVAVMLMHQGIVISTFKVFQTTEAFTGFIGTLYIIFLFVGLGRFFKKMKPNIKFRRNRYLLRMPPAEIDKLPLLAKVQRMMIPAGRWYPEKFRSRYRSVVSPFTQQSKSFRVAELIFFTVVPLISAYEVQEKNCWVLYSTLALIFVLYAILFNLLQPWSVKILNIVEGISLTTFACVLVVSALNQRDPSWQFAIAQGSLVFVQIFMMLVRGVVYFIFAMRDIFSMGFAPPEETTVEDEDDSMDAASMAEFSVASIDSPTTILDPLGGGKALDPTVMQREGSRVSHGTFSDSGSELSPSSPSAQRRGAVLDESTASGSPTGAAGPAPVEYKYFGQEMSNEELRALMLFTAYEATSPPQPGPDGGPAAEPGSPSHAAGQRIAIQGLEPADTGGSRPSSSGAVGPFRHPSAAPGGSKSPSGDWSDDDAL